MATLELTIDSSYVPNWDIFSAVREIIQNAKDADTLGNTMEVSYNKNRSDPTLQIINKGGYLEKSSLLLGGTTKRGKDNQIGNWGEGYKIAWLTLLRSGHKIWVRFQNEKWVPRLEYSETYGAELLKVDITKSQTFEPDLKVEVRGLAETDWLAIKERFLFAPFVELKENEKIELAGGKILLGEKYRGHLFVKGIWVASLPGKYYFGYDLSNVKLDRDRRLADPFDLKYEIKNVLNSAAQQNKLSPENLWSLFSGDQWEESRVILDMGDYGAEALAAKVAEHFKTLNGSGTEIVPVDSMQDSITAQHYGLKGVVVSKPIKRLVESVDGKFEDRRSQKALDVKDRFGVEQLSGEELENFTWAVDLLRKIEIDHPVVVVSFFGDNIFGTFNPNSSEICVAKKTLVDRKELLSTLVHEVAHHRSGASDATVEHRSMIENLFSQMVVELTK